MTHLMHQTLQQRSASAAQPSATQRGVHVRICGAARAGITFAICCALAMVSAALVSNCVSQRSFAATTKTEPLRYSFSQVEMGTTFTLIFYAENAEAANTASDAAFKRIAQLNALLSDYDDQSELSRLSASSPHAAAVPVSDELWKVLSHAQRLSKQTGGAFDVTVGPIVRLWRRARRQHEIPAPEQLAAARQATGYELLSLDEEKHAVQLHAADMRLDLGGIAKGYAADEALRVLRERGITQALVDAGGDLVAGDPPPGESSWRIAIAQPTKNDVAKQDQLEKENSPKRFVRISNAAVAQSGDTWQFIEIDGVRYSHIVDPHTGLGLTNQLAVTVIAPDGISADSLASAISVLGVEKGLALIADLQETEALLEHRPADGGNIQEKSSDGWKKYEDDD